MRGCGASDCGPTAGMPVLAAGRALAARKLARCTLVMPLTPLDHVDLSEEGEDLTLSSIPVTSTVDLERAPDTEDSRRQGPGTNMI